MNQVWIVEGPDGSGKTTLAEKMAQELGGVIWHEGPPPADCVPLDYYAERMLRALRWKRPVIFDRFHLGETVYGPLKRGGDTLGLYGLKLMDRLLRAHQVGLVLCLPRYEVCRQYWMEKCAAGVPDFLKSNELWHQSYHLFARYSNRYAVYDWVTGLKVPVWKDHTILPLGTIGSPSAKYLFVGEKINGGLDLPFWNGHASLFLNRALEAAGFQEHDIALTNLWKADGSFRQMARVLTSFEEHVKVIAIGKKVSTHLGVEHKKLSTLASTKFENMVQQLKEVR